MTNNTLNSFISTIRNLYKQSQSPQQQQQSIPIHIDVNFHEVYSTINSHINLFYDNLPNLIENVLPMFNLPEFTLPNIAVLYAIVTQLEQSTASTTANQARAEHTDEAMSASGANSINQERLMNEIENCIELSDERQVEIASDIFAELCHYYTNRLCQINKPKRGLSLLRTAIKKLQYESTHGTIRVNHLTTIHCDLLQLSLASGNFTAALELLSNDILDILKPNSSPFDSKYLLCYFYYAGCIYAALKQFELGLFYFEQALTTPAAAISQIMVESYKKFVLISLISKGKLALLPKYTSRIVLTQIKPLCSVYHELASAFVNYDQEKLNLLCQKYHDLFQQDRNFGLIKQLQQSFYKKNIQKLTKTFITLSLADMANKVKLPSAKDAENLMLNMIKDGEIFATINQKDGMVSFHDNPEKYDNPVIMESLTKQMFSCIQMDSTIKEMDKEITTHPHYIQKCQSNTSAVCDDSTDQLLQSTSVTSLRQAQAL